MKYQTTISNILVASKILKRSKAHALKTMKKQNLRQKKIQKICLNPAHHRGKTSIINEKECPRTKVQTERDQKIRKAQKHKKKSKRARVRFLLKNLRRKIKILLRQQLRKIQSYLINIFSQK